jgi:DNA-directed RNA polymerase specialized sigma subunit
MESDLQLISKIKEDNDSTCLSELIERHSGIYIYIVDKFTKHKNPLINRDSMLEEKDFAIYKSAINYDPSKSAKFSTYLANQTKWSCLNEINYAKKNNTLNIDEIYQTPSEEQRCPEILEKLEAFDLFCGMLNEEKDKRVKKIIDIRYNTSNNKLIPWRLVSEELDLSIQGCINIHNKFIKKVTKKLNKNYV